MQVLQGAVEEQGSYQIQNYDIFFLLDGKKLVPTKELSYFLPQGEHSEQLRVTWLGDGAVPINSRVKKSTVGFKSMLTGRFQLRSTVVYHGIGQKGAAVKGAAAKAKGLPRSGEQNSRAAVLLLFFTAAGLVFLRRLHSARGLERK